MLATAAAASVVATAAAAASALPLPVATPTALAAPANAASTTAAAAACRCCSDSGGLLWPRRPAEVHIPRHRHQVAEQHLVALRHEAEVDKLRRHPQHPVGGDGTRQVRLERVDHSVRLAVQRREDGDHAADEQRGKAELVARHAHEGPRVAGCSHEAVQRPVPEVQAGRHPQQAEDSERAQPAHVQLRLLLYQHLADEVADRRQDGCRDGFDQQRVGLQQAVVGAP